MFTLNFHIIISANPYLSVSLLTSVVVSNVVFLTYAERDFIHLELKDDWGSLI